MTVTVFFANADDDMLEGANAVYATAAGAASYNEGVGTTVHLIGQAESDKFYVEEYFCRFDTSSIPDDNIISAAELAFYGTADRTTGANPVFEVAAYDWSPTVAVADWRTPTQLNALTILATFDTGTLGWPVGSYNAFTSGQPLIDAINKTGSTYFVVWSQKHRNGTSPTLDTDEQIQVGSGDNANKPRLTVTYADPPILFTGRPAFMFPQR